MSVWPDFGSSMFTQFAEAGKRDNKSVYVPEKSVE